MIAISETSSGRASARDIEIWDPLVRLIHWSVALAILINGGVIDAESKLHEWIGYMVLTLIAVRVVWAFIGPRHARFTAFPPSPGRAIRHIRDILSGDTKIHLSHNPLGALMAYNIWLSVIALGVTGYMMTTLAYFGVEWVEEAHEAIFGWLLFSVALHVAGVAFDTWRSGVNLVRAMIVGKKLIPKGRQTE